MVAFQMMDPLCTRFFGACLRHSITIILFRYFSLLTWLQSPSLNNDLRIILRARDFPNHAIFLKPQSPNFFGLDRDSQLARWNPSLLFLLVHRKLNIFCLIWFRIDFGIFEMDNQTTSMFSNIDLTKTILSPRLNQ